MHLCSRIDLLYDMNWVIFLMIMYSVYETAQSYVKYEIVPELRDKREKIINNIVEGIVLYIFNIYIT